MMKAAPADSDGFASYEERMTLWNADSFESACALARAEANSYVETFHNGAVLDVFHVFRLFDVPGVAFPGPSTTEIFSPAAHGAEVFSVMRASRLDPEEFVEQFLSLGAELETARTRTFESDAPD